MERRRVKGGILAAIGFVLSPLSWWNDLVVNLPLAYAFGVAVSLISRSWFLPGVVAGYWLTNVAGFVLLHKGAVDAVSAEPRPYTARRFAKDFAISVGYTALVVLLVWFGFLTVPDGLLAALGR
ncbi:MULTISPECIES: hypothetical protein [Haloferax]|uniref:Uncharacterized protein n=1 Tax=Haloferax massiliensis TaxID=1476858 RepID=A0A0D6JWD9_9EURY|nr:MULTISPECIES: hypothetical protein [Haloferax]MDS0240801.1 hypothetical protein [Haloferax sp. S2CR25]MDS0443922.1 hypothetical protein [Haloferax sp. S2CR25-2]CQR53733.1 hypothetical protein BN996_03768 [Haloferax massiliensis]